MRRLKFFGPANCGEQDFIPEISGEWDIVFDWFIDGNWVKTLYYLGMMFLSCLFLMMLIVLNIKWL